MTSNRPALLWLCLLLLLPCLSVYAQDNNAINTAALLHDSRDDLYRTPFGAVPFDTSVTLRLRAAAGDIDSVSVRVYRTYDESQTLIPMAVIATTPDGYDLWEATLETGLRPTVYYYRFMATKGDQIIYYEDDTRPNGFDYVEAAEGGVGTTYEQSPDLSFQISVYDPEFYTPEWMRNAVVYQIFPDRFRNGDENNDPEDGSDVFYGELDLIYHETWNEPPVDGRTSLAPSGAGYYNSDFYGGDLAGIIEKLDYLEELGVTAIYMTPIFEARSNHRYDTSDYLHIDPVLGNLETFRALVEAAESRGMRIILDGVFNHMSSDSRYFDRYDRFAVEGACESVDSPYRLFFLFTAPRENQPSPCVETPDNLTYYLSWAGFDSIPKLNSALIDVRRFIFLDDDSVTRTWLREGIAGWRLDVANEIDDGRNPTELYWEAFRSVVRSENPEAIIIGEFWHDASEWLLGDEWDATMNYRFRRAIVGFVRDTDFRDNDGSIPALSPSQFDGAVRAVQEDYPPMAYHAMMNLLDSHDTTRLYFAVDESPSLQKLAALTQFTLPGAPTVYYGDEVSIDAPSIADDGGTLQDDPFNRAPYPWHDTSGSFYRAPDEDMLAFYQQIAALRHDNPALREGEMRTLVSDDATGVYAFLRLDPESQNVAVVVLNTSEDAQDVLLDWSGYVPTGLTLTPAFEDEILSTDRGSAQVTVEPLTGNVWTALGTDSAFLLPDAPENVQTLVSEGMVTVTWDAAEDVAGYLVYRSPVATGGFELLDGIPVLDTTFTDDQVQNGFAYYYAVAAVSDATLIGHLSESALAVPAAEIDAAFYVGDDATDAETPHEPIILPLVSGTTTTIEAAIRIEELTKVAGPAPGIRAEVALIESGGDLTDGDWQPMTYTGELNGADVYAAEFAPQTTGEFNTVARFSTDAGQTWTTVTYRDATLPVLIVEASDDTTPPAAPAQLAITRASLSGVFLDWEPVDDEALFGYRVYRMNEDDETSLVGEVPADAPRFVDPNVVEGDRYRYAVSAVDGALNESELVSSDEVTIEQQLIAVSFTVEVPAETDGTLYLAGSFGTSEYPSWDPTGIAMEPVDATHWTVTLELPEGAAVEYKFARGNWETVEKGAECEELANRRFAVILGDAETLTVDHTVENWRDMQCGG